MIRVTRKLFQILSSGQKRFIPVLVLLMLIGGLVESLSVSLVLPLITAVMDVSGWNEKWYSQFICNLFSISDQRTYIKVLLVMVMLVFIAKNIYLYLEYYIQYSFIAKSRYAMQSKLIKRYLNKPYPFYLYASSGEILRIIKTDTAQTFALLTTILNFYMEIIVGFVVAITVFVINPQIAGMMVVVLLLEVLLIGKVVKPRLRRYGENLRSESASASKWVIQAINGIKSIKVGQNESFFAEKYTGHLFQEIDMAKRQQVIDNSPKLVTETFTIVAVLGLLFVYISDGMELSLLVSQLTAFAVAAMRLIPCANRISAGINQIPFYEGAVDNIIENLKVEGRFIEQDDEVVAKVNRIEANKMSCEKEIKFQDVTFAYEGSERKILDSANFSIKVGESVGVVGPSGAGKTTAIDLMLGLLQPVSGQILVDDVDIESDISKWLSNVAYIPQQIFLIDDTIRKNIAFGCHMDEIDEDRVWVAAKEAQLEEFIRSLTDGLDTKIGEAGVRISGGQKQRIGIARALYYDPKVLIFDEATSALDNDTESAIMSVIDNLRGKRTLIIIAHRLTTIKNCDVVYRVQDGQVTVEDKEKL